MKVLTILGSPRKKGNTVQLLDIFEEALTGRGHRIQRVNIVDLSVKSGCVECYKCQKPDAPFNCAIKDDLNQVFEDMADADAIALASPVFWWSFPAQVKTLIDRSVCLIKEVDTPSYRTALEGKPIALLASAGGDMADNADLLVRAYTGYCQWTKAREAGYVMAVNTPYVGGPEERYLDQAVALAAGLAA